MRWAAVLLVVLVGGCAATEPPATGPSGPSSAAATPPPELLPGEPWVLLESVPAPDMPQFSVSMQFEPGRVSGKAPVNTYFGPLSVSADSMTLGPLARTEMAGSPAAMRAEAAFFAAAERVSGWTVADDLLTLSGDDGPLLVFAAPDSTGAFAVTLLDQRRAAAKAATLAAGYVFRVVSVDGAPRAVTLDYRSDRINATIEDGRVTRVSVG